MVGIPPKTFEHAHSMMDELIQQNDMQQDTTKSFMDSPLSELITGPAFTENILMPLFGGLTKKLGLFSEPAKEKAAPFLDFTGMEDLSRKDVEQAWSDLPTYGRFTKWKGGRGKKYVDMPTPTRLDKHTDFPIENILEFMKLVDIHGLPDEKGKFYKPQTVMRNE